MHFLVLGLIVVLIGYCIPKRNYIGRSSRASMLFTGWALFALGVFFTAILLLPSTQEYRPSDAGKFYRNPNPIVAVPPSNSTVPWGQPQGPPLPGSIQTNKLPQAEIYTSPKACPPAGGCLIPEPENSSVLQDTMKRLRTTNPAPAAPVKPNIYIPPELRCTATHCPQLPQVR